MYCCINNNDLDLRNLLDESQCYEIEKICTHGCTIKTLEKLSDFINQMLKSEIDIPLNDSAFEQIYAEMLLFIYNNLTIYFPTLIHGTSEFIDSLDFQKPIFTYTKESSYVSFTNKMKFSTVTECFIPATSNENDKIIADNAYLRFFSRTRKSLYIIESTPLEKYVFTHYIGSNKQPENPLFDYSRYIEKPSNNTNATLNRKEANLYLRNGRNFSAMLFKLITDKINIPYTTKAANGITLKSVNNLFDVLFKAYNDDGLKDEASLEQLLFLLNAEYIFKPSLLPLVLSTFYELSNKKNGNDILFFAKTLDILFLLNDCQLNTLRSLLWKSIDKVLCAEYQCGIYPSSIPIRHKMVSSAIEVSNRLIKILQCALLTTSKTDEACSDLKTVLESYLKSKQDCFNWSILTSQTMHELRPLSSDYYTFYILYVLYSTTTAALTVAKTDLIAPSNQYLRFILKNR